MSTSDTADPFRHLQQTYFDECAELLDALIDHVSTLSTDDPDREKLNTIFRAVHSIKAGAGAFKFSRLVSFSHSFEAVLERLRSGQLALNRDLIDLLVRASDVLQDLVAAAQSGSDADSPQEAALLGQLDAYVAEETSGSEPALEGQPDMIGPGTIRLKARESLLTSGNEPLLILEELGRLVPIRVAVEDSALPALEAFDPETCYLSWVITLEQSIPLAQFEGVFEFAADDCMIEVLPDVPGTGDQDTDGFGLFEPAAPPASHAAMKPAGVSMVEEPTATRPRTSSIRVDLQRVDRLVNMVGELVIAQSMVLQNITDKTANHELSQLRGLEDLTLRTRELQESVMAIRMQPVKSVFSRMPRVVRDLADKLGKKITLRTAGEETEVDKTVIEELSDPLTHMIRNALDHGLEPPEERLAAGKPETGTIELTAEHRGGRILICIADDGRGINRDRVRQKAVERGIVSDEAAAALSPAQVDQLIFAPGFSTASSVSEISGRGVGMDVVRRNIQGLGGRITIDSVQGQGTRIVLTLPLTLAVLDGMVIMLGGERYILPLTGILECVRPTRTDLRTLASGVQVLSIRGAFIPLIYLGSRLGIPGAAARAEDALVVLVEMESGRRVGIVVDELLGQQQVVIKSLEENYRSIDGVSGATILGDGRVALIIDVDALNPGDPGRSDVPSGVPDDAGWFDETDIRGNPATDQNPTSNSERVAA
ncbi:MAG: chemotaxis protein CheA [Alphaproteobacteria bacterium]